MRAWMLTWMDACVRACAWLKRIRHETFGLLISRCNICFLPIFKDYNAVASCETLYLLYGYVVKY
jgi:hypothetical protein